MKDEAFMAFVNSLLRYAVTFASELNVPISRATVTDVLDGMMSVEFGPSKSRP